MINIKLLSGELYQIIHLDETTITYEHLIKHIKVPIQKYEEFKP